MEIEEKNVVKWQKLKIEAQQQTIDKLNKEGDRWGNELNLQIGWLDVERKKTKNLTKEVEGLRERNIDLSFHNKAYSSKHKEFIKENTKLLNANILLANERLKLTKGLNDIKSQLFDVNNCDTILTSTIEQILKNK